MIKNLIKRFEFGGYGSALILTIVLTVLLAMIAVVFVAVARMDSAATSNIADNKALDLSAKSIIDTINRQLIMDTPGIGGNYYDYPDSAHPWLASNEPYQSGTIYNWRQISDVTGFLSSRYSTINVNTDPCGSSEVIKDYPVINLDNNGNLQENFADADGDGIADSKWFEIADIRSSKGAKIYAAVRVIDNGGMINVNTADTFNPAGSQNQIDGSSQMQINLAGLLKSGDNIANLDSARGSTLSNYEKNVIWQYGIPTGGYLPFDISDELELRYRYCIDSKTKSRFESVDPCTNKGYGRENYGNLYDASSNWGLSDWQTRITDPNFGFVKNTNEDRRHLLTTMSIDRIIAPDGNKMTNINVADVNTLYSSIRKGLMDGGTADANVAAQLAVNIIGYRESNSSVVFFNNPDNGKEYFGFTAQPFITEVAAVIDVTKPQDANKDFYAVELYNPFKVPVPLDNFTLSLSNGTDIPLDGSITIDPNGFFVIYNDSSKFTINCPAKQKSADLILSNNYVFDSGTGLWSLNNYNLKLKRKVDTNTIVLDAQNTDNSWFAPPPSAAMRDAQRDTTNCRFVYQIMSVSIDPIGGGTLGTLNIQPAPLQKNYNLLLADSNFVSVGDIARVLKIGPGFDSNGIGEQLALMPPESSVRMDLTQAAYQKIFNYLTVFDPHNYVADANETRIKGRININTAPAFVLTQLPWVSLRNNGTYNDPNLANAIVACRDKQNLSASSGPDFSATGHCFTSIGQLMNVTGGADSRFGIDYYKRGLPGDQTSYPDLTPNDGAADDFEERDLIFARISNLVTVRSDVFTAYILVRIGTNGPQKRYMAILDRSETTSANPKIKIRAFGVVPEAR